ncbi:MAG: cobyric acid synthase, partial [Methylotenera sp.]
GKLLANSTIHPHPNPPPESGRALSRLKVIAPVLPHISNHTDFDALRLHPKIDFQFVKMGEAIPPADLIILPGSKNVRGDLEYLKANGWQQALTRHLRYGGKVLGICGGFQMLGKIIHDPHAVEGESGSSQGLGWLDLETTLEKKKRLAQVSGKLAFADATVTGYEIHMGISSGAALGNPALFINDQPEGAISQDNQIAGTYLHGLFDHPEASAAWLKWAGLANTCATAFNYEQLREAELERLADCVEQHLDWDKLKGCLSVEPVFWLGEARN